ncbi:gliding motility lipoprotein GldB [Flavobacterium nitrogenifigens]|uniref:Protein involved in gliding motility GldB n=1 Tax=Flavobacterium nitrogenifigens TaxID=1617283 RepID=A0A521EXH7_9FLAO|nr:gliding motility lipoprotein GldB [Flavobacterium nitrogenifigens]KAF2333299.1 gliding motility lipoprotein GldB [Flavobacterium nitrogenifigens]SMO88615.1 protein involved in gliding motility GldB [Flavobacterium nitrogenifigens]
MKIYRFAVVLCLFFLSCNQKSKVEKAVEEIPVDIKVERFDKVFFETKPQDLPKIKKQYPFFFPGNDDNVWVQKMNDPIWREVYEEVQKKYSNFEPVRKEFNELFQHVKYYFPKTKIPKVITVIGEMDYNAKSIYADSLVVVALELYLGKDHKFYEFPNYLKENFEERQIMPDVVSSFSYRNIPNSIDRSLVAQMIFEGKQLYAKDLLIPEYTDAEKMGYTPEQIKWCEENEAYMWRYFIENEMLYNEDPKLRARFIAPAPFSKFFLEIDNDSPGRVGAWIGWQMVRSYMKNNSDVSLAELFKLEPKEIFEKSKYKPKK